MKMTRRQIPPDTTPYVYQAGLTSCPDPAFPHPGAAPGRHPRTHFLDDRVVQLCVRHAMRRLRQMVR
jgi:hypothetical protein